MKKKNYKFMMLIWVVSLTLAACGGQQISQTPPPVEPVSVNPDGIIAEGKLKPERAANLSFQAHGMVEEVAVNIGDQGEFHRNRALRAEEESRPRASNNRRLMRTAGRARVNAEVTRVLSIRCAIVSFEPDS